jgi:hypothetical protein
MFINYKQQEKNRMIKKGDLEEGKVYKVNHQEFGEFIGKYLMKKDDGKLVFLVIHGGLDYRDKFSTRPGLARYYEHKYNKIEF